MTARRLAAILAADVVGYSRLVSADEADALSRLSALRRAIIEPNIIKHSGRLFKVMGDGFLAEFASAVQAVTCAMAIQADTERAAETLDDTRKMRLRIGIHVGDVMIEGDDLMGEGVNIASRLEGIAAPGGISVSRAVHDQVRDRIDVAFDDKGEIALKNIARPVQVFALAGAKANKSPNSTPALALPDKPSIAVLAFQNMSGDPDQEYFADGMVEDIITALSKFKSLFVIARNSSFTYKGNAVDIKQVGRELGVRYVLEGSVRKSGSRVRITGQLIEVATGAHLWADRFDGELADVFDLQDRVTSSVVGVIEPKIEQVEIERILRKPTSDLAAYDCYLRGIASWDRWTQSGNEEALQMFSRAVELDPNYVAAIAAASTCYGQRVMQQWVVDPEKETADALRLAKRGLEIGRDDAWVLTTSAIIIMFTGDIETAVELSDRAIRINPNLDRGWSHSGWIRVFAGHPELAIEHSLKALQLNPLGSHRYLTRTPVALSHFLMDRNEEALIWADRALADNPNQLPTMRFVAAIKAVNGRLEEAKQIVKNVLKMNPEDRFSKIALVRYIRRPDYRRKLVDALRLAGLPE
jgi:TolB-like protein/tetratricopeptide (TPR) repeat protein